MSRIDKEGCLIRESIIAENNVLQVNSQVLTAAVILPVGAPPLQFLDANGVARNVNLPANNIKGGFFIIHNPAAAAFSLTVRDFTGATTVGTVAQGKSALFVCNGDGTITAWKVLLGA